VRLLKARGLEVIFRDEDFFHGYCGNSHAALLTLEAAKSAGADVLCLRDSTGADVPQLVREVSIEVRKRFEGTLGICAHDDSELALANTLEAVEQGFTHVEGSLNAYGSRRGLANLCSIISSLEHRLGHTTIGMQNLDDMSAAARAMAEAEAAALGRRMRTGAENPPRSGETVLQAADPHLLQGVPERRRRALLDQVEMMESEGTTCAAPPARSNCWPAKRATPKLAPSSSSVTSWPAIPACTAAAAARPPPPSAWASTSAPRPRMAMAPSTPWSAPCASACSPSIPRSPACT